jgi:hypothetical protein
MSQPAPAPRRHVISEPRLVLVALLATAVGVLSIIAILETDDIWIVAVTFIAIVLVVALLVIDLYRVLDRSDSEDGDNG